MRELPVKLGERTYSIFIGTSILGNTGELLRRVSGTYKVLVVSNPKVFSLYGKKLLDSLDERGFESITALMPDGEEFKNMEEAIKILNQAVDAKLERNAVIMALGGGVAGDLAGFVAAIYQRGLDFVQVPTTLLAQVDSSVGGKVAVNHPRGKNMIGAFHQPRMVVIDSSTLSTLAQRDYLSGLGEVIKYGIIYEAEFFSFIENNAEKIIKKDEGCLQELIYRSCRIKSEIVEQDEKEMGVRAILNLGHTFGHAVEKLGEYQEYRHGEAVVMGTMAAAYLALDMGLLEQSELERILELFKRLGISPGFPSYDPAQVYDGMLNDKKIANKKLRLILPRGIGDYLITDTADKDKKEVIKAIERAQKGK